MCVVNPAAFIYALTAHISPLVSFYEFLCKLLTKVVDKLRQINYPVLLFCRFFIYWVRLMAYTVLARRYRSQTFDDVVGQDSISRTLKNAIKAGRVAHAYLFTGTRGVGKTTMARILAKSLNCLSYDEPTVEPCCQCDSCKSINNGEDLDVIEIDGASNNGVDNIRELRQNAIYKPARSRYKIYIIDEIHMLSPGAFNALLKILEEPPEHVKFIFATTEPNKVLPTIQSRCQRFDFRAIDPENITFQLKSVLEQEGITYQDDYLITLSRLANGSMRDSLSLLDQVISAGIEPITAEVVETAVGEPGREKISELVALIGAQDAGSVLEKVNSLLFEGMTCIQIIDSMIEFMRDLMVLSVSGAETKVVILTPAQKQQALELAQKFDIAALVYNIASLEKMRWTVKNADNPRALMEAIMVRMALSEKFINVPYLASKIASGQISVKKNSIGNPSTSNNSVNTGSSADNSPSRVSARRAQPAQVEETEVFRRMDCQDLQSLRGCWNSLVSQIIAKNGIIGTSLDSCVPAEFDGCNLLLAFPKAFKMSKKLCESNGRTEKICQMLTEILGRNIMVRFEISEDVDGPQRKKSKGAGTSQRDVEDAMMDQGVKELLNGLRAKVVKIEQ